MDMLSGGIRQRLEGAKGQVLSHLFGLYLVCVRKHLSPSCHPCHPLKRVQTPYTSAFCHPDTLFKKNSCTENLQMTMLFQGVFAESYFFR